MSLLVVYNTCGLSGKEDLLFYEKAINNILKQDLDNVTLAISSCMNSLECRKYLIDKFKDRVIFNFIQEKKAVNVTFNHTVKKCVSKYGEYDGYMYVASDVDVGENSTLLKRLCESFELNKYGMLSARVDKDHGYECWFGTSKLPTDEDFIVPLGKTCNLHAQIFSNDIYKNFDEKILPDIFTSFCTESVFSFVCAAIKKKFAISKDVTFSHQYEMDGSCMSYGRGHDMVYPGNPKTIKEICADPVGIAAGFGYEEWRSALIHDSSQFDENGFSIDNRLKTFIKENLYLKKEILNYDNLDYCFFKLGDFFEKSKR
jgi:hypothetical protein